jgi:hypothetical protein
MPACGSLDTGGFAVKRVKMLQFLLGIETVAQWQLQNFIFYYWYLV